MILAVVAAAAPLVRGVAVPALTGHAFAAKKRLRQVGLTLSWFVQQRIDPDAQPASVIEAAAVAAGTLILLATLIWKDWVELVFGADPDNRFGSLEWGIVAIAAAVTTVMMIAVRREWSRAQPAEG